MGAGRGTRAVAALAAVVWLCACSQVQRPALPSPLPTDVPYAFHLQTTSGGDGALLEGTLELENGCLVVLTSYEGIDDEFPPVVPVLPIAVTTWDGTTLTVNGESAAVGEPISLGGGHGTSLADASFVPDGCPALSETDGNYFYVGING